MHVTCMCVGEAQVIDMISGHRLLPSHHFLSLENTRQLIEQLTLGIIATKEERGTSTKYHILSNFMEVSIL